MRLAVLIHAVSQIAQTPIFSTFDGAAHIFDLRCKGLDEFFDLVRRNVRPCNHDMLIKRHLAVLQTKDDGRCAREGGAVIRWMERPGTARTPPSSGEARRLRETGRFV